jgi:histidinol-phosphatase (PHP family)
MTDLHSHTYFSHDGQCTIEELILKAIENKVQYLGISEHVDYDCLYNNIEIKQFNPDAYFKTAFELKEKYKDRLNIIVGIECAFYDKPQVNKMYSDLIEKFKPEYVINSVHMAGNTDYYSAIYGNKQKTYEFYLQQLYRSVNCDYYFDIIGHIGYVVRYAPYDDKKMSYLEFKSSYNKILKTLIEKNKILEINSSCNLDFTYYLPTLDVFQAYYKLGGRKISFGSDTHTAKRLLDKRELIIKDLKNIGFDHFTVPINKKHIEVEI